MVRTDRSWCFTVKKLRPKKGHQPKDTLAGGLEGGGQMQGWGGANEDVSL